MGCHVSVQKHHDVEETGEDVSGEEQAPPPPAVANGEPVTSDHEQPVEAATNGETKAVVTHTLLGRCDCGRVHKRDYLASRFGNPYLASSSASSGSEEYNFSYCPLPRLSQPQLSRLNREAQPRAEGAVLPPPQLSAAKNWLDLPVSPTRQLPQLALPAPKKSADALRADAVNTWLTKR
jgi:hypothetical protein